MSAIAKILLLQGAEVTGSDIKDNGYTKRLTQEGARIFYEHREENIGDAELVVYSSAIRPDNPELCEARRRGIPVISRGQMLAQMMEGKRGVVVAGTHGKTTTTSMIAYMLKEGGLSPTFAVGAECDRLGWNAGVGESDVFVAEADESDGSFLYLKPYVGVVTNIDDDHLNFYGTQDALIDAFRKFVGGIEEGGVLVYCRECPNMRKVGEEYEGRKISYGLKEADIVAEDIKFHPLGAEFAVRYKGEMLGKMQLSVPGLHNVLNAMAAVGVGLEFGIDFDKIRFALRGFSGVKRRFEIKGEVFKILVVDDYAHHPAEIAATLAAAKGLGKRRVIAVFQPHRYTRTSALLSKFPEAFQEADFVIVTKIYPAGEKPIKGLTGKRIADAINKREEKKAIYIPTGDDVIRYLLRLALPGDVVMTIGAGDVWKLGELFLQVRRAFPLEEVG